MSDFATAWQKWFPVIEGGAAPLSRRMLELAAIAPGHDVLDLATGIGEPALAAARRVGAQGRVTGVDISAEMLVLARRRAEAAGLSNLTFLEAGLEALALPPESFHAALCRWGLMFVTDLPAALCRLRPMLKPGGRFVAAVWGPPERVPALSLATRVVYEVLDLGPAAEGYSGAFALSDVEGLQKAMESAGFTGLHGEWFPVTYRFPSPESYCAYRSDCLPALVAKMAAFPAKARNAAWQAVADAAAAYRDESGGLTMVNWAYLTRTERGA